MKTALVFGASGQIGAPAVELLRAAGWRVLAVSRQARGDAAGVHWIQADLPDPIDLPWQVDFSWLMTSKTFVKFVEGGYD